MASQITNYQCPACTGPLHFSASLGLLECEYCSSTYTVEEMEAQYGQKEQAAVQAMEKAAASDETDWDASGLSDDWGADADGMRAYNCPSCGAQLICDETTAATACPYCGNPTVVPGQFSGALRPEFVIPFQVDKQQAIQALKKHYAGKIFLPKLFQSQHTVEKIQGVYVPFWLYNGQATGEFQYHATRSSTHREGDREVTETDHYQAYRAGSLDFEKVPVDASSKMPDDYMDSIEPFDYNQLKPFSSAYLPGFLADKYDVTVEQSKERADQRCIRTFEKMMTETVQGYETVDMRSKNITLNRGKVQYALLPVWMLTVNWNSQNYLFAINGQTGKTAGNLPVSKGKAAGFFAMLGCGLSLLSYLLALLMMS